jgi:hypothetical protein
MHACTQHSHLLALAQTKLETFLERNKTVDNITHYNYTNNMAIRE